jgi:hypothetical protein
MVIQIVIALVQHRRISHQVMVRHYDLWLSGPTASDLRQVSKLVRLWFRSLAGLPWPRSYLLQESLKNIQVFLAFNEVPLLVLDLLIELLNLCLVVFDQICFRLELF